MPGTVPLQGGTNCRLSSCFLLPPGRSSWPLSPPTRVAVPWSASFVMTFVLKPCLRRGTRETAAKLVLVRVLHVCSTRTGKAQAEQNEGGTKPTRGTEQIQAENSSTSPAQQRQAPRGFRNNQPHQAALSNLSRRPGLPAQRGPTRGRRGDVQARATQGGVTAAKGNAVPGSSRKPRSQRHLRSIRSRSQVEDGNVTHHEPPGTNKKDVHPGPRANGVWRAPRAGKGACLPRNPPGQRRQEPLPI
jgi:hypothetical protein